MFTRIGLGRILRGLSSRPVSLSLVWLSSAISCSLIVVMLASVELFLEKPIQDATLEKVVRIGGLTQPPFGAAVDFWNAGRLFEKMAEYKAGTAVTSNQARDAEGPVPVAAVSSDFFDVLGLKPLCGQFPDDEALSSGNEMPAVVSASLLGTATACNSGIIGQKIRVNNQLFVIAAVAKPSLSFPGGAKVWIPRASRDRANPADTLSVTAFSGWIGKLAEGKSVDSAQVELHGRLSHLNSLTARSGRKYGDMVTVAPLVDYLVRDRRTVLLLLGSASLALAVIAALNVTVLIIVRLYSRRKELMIRKVLGAENASIATLIAEELLVWLLPSIWLAAIAMEPLWKVVAPQLASPFLAIPESPIHEVWFALGASAVALPVGILTGRIWARHFTEVDASELREHSIGQSLVPPRLRGVLVASQIGATLVLCVLAMGALQSLNKILSAPLGFNSAGVFFYQAFVPPDGPDSEAAWARAMQLPEVLKASGLKAAVSLGTGLPLADYGMQYVFVREGENRAPYRLIACGPEYFKTLGIRLIAGRVFQSQDKHVVIMDTEGVARLGLSENPLGRAILLDGEESPRVLIGIVAATQDERSPLHQRVYTPLAHTHRGIVPRQYFLAMRCGDDCDAQLRAMQPDVQRVMGSGKPHSLENIERLRVAPAIGKFRMLALYAGVGILIAIVGVYGLVSQITLYRQKECLIRVALGATSWSIGFLLLRSIAKSLSGGTLLGLAVAWMLTRLTQASIYGLADPDALSMIVAVGAVLFFAVAAAFIPIYRLCRYGLQTS